MFKEYLTDVLGRLSSTRLQSIHTHLFTLVLISILVIIYVTLVIIKASKTGVIELIEVPDNVTNLVIFIITILFTYASAPKAFAQRSELKTYREINSKEPSNSNTNVNS